MHGKSAPEGPRHVARDVSPWNPVHRFLQSPEGATSSCQSVAHFDVAPPGLGMLHTAMSLDASLLVLIDFMAWLYEPFNRRGLPSSTAVAKLSLFGSSQ